MTSTKPEQPGPCPQSTTNTADFPSFSSLPRYRPHHAGILQSRFSRCIAVLGSALSAWAATGTFTEAMQGTALLAAGLLVVASFVAYRLIPSQRRAEAGTTPSTVDV